MADAGAVLCARDQDCDDGQFCNGTESCRPGDPAADSAGCVTIAAPCAASECDEAADRCTACAADEADRDGDGEPSVACGGADCDDEDGRRYPSATETCDAMGVDEDCDPSTLFDGSSAGAAGDRDGDGRVDAACFNTIDGVEVSRGDDCDDTDPAVFAGAPERCNGVDDDCDGVIDEDFDCVQGQTASGLNACGRTGMRRCDESCGWLDDAFSRAEGAATCDYCDDSGDGLGEEIPFATESANLQVDDMVDLYGDAMLRVLLGGDDGFVIEGANARGAVYAADAIQLGYGLTYVRGIVESVARVTPSCMGFTCNEVGGLWSFVVLRDGAASFLDGSRADGLPSEDGLAWSWSFSQGFPAELPDDQLRLTRLSPSGPNVLSSVTAAVANQDGPAGEAVIHAITVLITPDDPRTAADESSAEVFLPVGTGLRCSNAGPGPACGISFTPGDRLRVGVVGAVTASREAELYVAFDQNAFEITQNGLCPAP